jgi:hypothetical protein
LFSACSKELSNNTNVNTEVLQMEAIGGKAPLYNNEPGAKYIPNSYIVVYQDNVEDVDGETDNITRSKSYKSRLRIKNIAKGFIADMSAADMETLRSNPKVKYIEQDQVYSINTTQTAATWGLDRIDQVSIPLSSTFSYAQTASTVDAYVFDTGILPTHTQFGGRVRNGYTAFGANSTDDNGHGTHVSGTIGGSTYGVAKSVNLIAVKVLNSAGSGSSTTVIAGLEWAVTDHINRPAVGNMSLGGGASATIDAAARKVIADGIVLCVAAGNNNLNASAYSPARVAEAITVGATTNTDALASYSNYGAGVDILAPGSSITSSWFTSTTATNTISGTSMATPHVTGVAALYKAINPSATPAQVETALKAAASKNKVSGLTGLKATTPNNLLFTNY